MQQTIWRRRCSERNDLARAFLRLRSRESLQTHTIVLPESKTRLLDFGKEVTSVFRVQAEVLLPGSISCRKTTNWLPGWWSGICEACAGRSLPDAQPPPVSVLQLAAPGSSRLAGLQSEKCWRRKKLLDIPKHMDEIK